MILQLDCSTTYLLFDAFNRLGDYLYGDEWTKLEAWARPCDPPDLLRRRDSQLVGKLRKIDAELAALSEEHRFARELGEQERLSQLMQPLRIERQRMQVEWDSIPVVTDTYIDDHAAFLRREHTERTLCEAAGESTFGLRYATGPNIDWPTWRGEAGFKLYLNLSMAVVPPKLSSLRRGPVFVDRVPFDKWLDTLLPLNAPPNSPYVRRAAFVNFFNAEVQKGERRYSRTAMQEIAQGEYEIGTREFGRIWSEHAPEHWKRAGRIPDKEKS